MFHGAVRMEYPFHATQGCNSGKQGVEVADQHNTDAAIDSTWMRGYCQIKEKPLYYENVLGRMQGRAAYSGATIRIGREVK